MSEFINRLKDEYSTHMSHHCKSFDVGVFGDLYQAAAH